uniref:G-protein coupled receptors family 1 profile domain-containing protein n=1 Tax=Oreochromis aureus TaxID=47969 RepID=A0AAZ1WVD9_OREAU
MDYGDYNNTYPDGYYTFPDITESVTPEIKPIQIAALAMYSLVALLGVPGNALVVALRSAGLHAHQRPVLLLYCSVLQLVVISVDRLFLVIRPIWCQNHRRPKKGAYGCVAVWVLALIGSIPQFVYAKQIEAGDEKRECRMEYTVDGAWPVSVFRFLIGFIIPFLVILVCHLVVFSKTQRRMTHSRSGSKKTLRVIISVVLSFFLCWLPLHIVDFLMLTTPRVSSASPKLHLAHVIALCLAYFNSCLNPLLYVCLGQSFKDSMNRSLRNILHFIGEDPTTKNSVTNVDTKSTSNGNEMTKI